MFNEVWRRRSIPSQKKECFPDGRSGFENQASIRGWRHVAQWISNSTFSCGERKGGSHCFCSHTASEESRLDEIKTVDASFGDLQHDITAGSGTMYVVKSGDDLSNISKSFYGNANDYSKIAEANNISIQTEFKPGSA